MKHLLLIITSICSSGVLYCTQAEEPQPQLPLVKAFFDRKGPEAQQLLAQHRADSGYLNQVDEPTGFNALTAAILTGYLPTAVQLLQAGAVPQQPAENDMNLLGIIVEGLNTDHLRADTEATTRRLVQLLIEKRESVDHVFEDNLTPLGLAALKGKLFFVKIFLGHNPKVCTIKKAQNTLAVKKGFMQEAQEQIPPEYEKIEQLLNNALNRAPEDQ